MAIEAAKQLPQTYDPLMDWLNGRIGLPSHGIDPPIHKCFYLVPVEALSAKFWTANQLLVKAEVNQASNSNRLDNG